MRVICVFGALRIGSPALIFQARSPDTGMQVFDCRLSLARASHDLRGASPTADAAAAETCSYERNRPDVRVLRLARRVGRVDVTALLA
jgi:hypothetical protein